MTGLVGAAAGRAAATGAGAGSQPAPAAVPHAQATEKARMERRERGAMPGTEGGASRDSQPPVRPQMRRMDMPHLLSGIP